ncbi:MAG TPA: hypothetical protein PKG98_10180 [Myxococcota bacterium]|nr:hypothetical protein [Myxococcota bacterium]
MNRIFWLLTIIVVASAGCGTSNPEPVETAEQLEPALVADFVRLVSLQKDCSDIPAFIDLHTKQARSALADLDTIVEPGLLEPSKAAVTGNLGALWVCLVARNSGFTPDRVKVERTAIDPRVKLARVIFSIDGGMYAFPMARQDGVWRSPYPGQVMLATYYAEWLDLLNASVPETNWAKLHAMLERSKKTLEGFSPNWQMYPDLGREETDQVQLMLRERLRRETAEEMRQQEAAKAAGTTPAVEQVSP